MGVAGAAIGTVIAESLAVLMCLVYMKKKMPMLWVSREDFRNTKKAMVAYVLKLSVPTSLQVSVVSLVAFMTVFVLFSGRILLSIFVDDGNSAAVVEEGYLYLKITCGFYVFLSLWQAYMAVLRGMADVLMPLVIGGIQIAANLAAVWILEPILGKGGIWLAVGFSWGLCCLVSLVRMRKYRASFTS